MAERRFHVRGEVDISSAPLLHANLDDAVEFSDADLVIDCSELTFIDSSGLSVLVAVQRRLATLGRRLRITNASAAVERVMQISGLTDALLVNRGPDSGHAATA